MPDGDGGRRRAGQAPPPSPPPSRARRSSGPRPAPASSGSATPGLKELAGRLNDEFGAGHRRRSSRPACSSRPRSSSPSPSTSATGTRSGTTTSPASRASITRTASRSTTSSTAPTDPGTLIELRVRTAEAEGAGRGPLGHPRLARGRLPGARGLRHDGRPVHRAPRAEAHPDVGRLRLLSRSARTSSNPTTRGRPRSSTAASRRASASTSGPRSSTPTARTSRSPRTSRTGRASTSGDDTKGKALLPGGVEVSELDTDQFVISMGPQHPSTHGVFRMNLRVDGETIVGLKPVMGYMHRNHEKIGERNTFLMNFPFTDRLDYLTSMGNNFGYALAVEQLMGDDAKPPERAEYIRVIMAELTRIASHMWSIGFLLNDLGAFFTPALYAIEERELILDLFEWAAGSRMMCNYFRFGGVAFDLPPGWVERCRGIVNDRLDRQDRRAGPLPLGQRDRARPLQGRRRPDAASRRSTSRPPARCCGPRASPTTSAARRLTASTTGSTSTSSPARTATSTTAIYVRLQEMRRERQDPQAGPPRPPRRADPAGQEELPDQGAGRRGLLAGREPQGRAGLLRRRRRLGRRPTATTSAARASST